jgi:hypothetical protein
VKSWFQAFAFANATCTATLRQQSGWQELDSLRKKLEELRELRDLVRSLGRGAGRGPLRRAPRQRERQAGLALFTLTSVCCFTTIFFCYQM